MGRGLEESPGLNKTRKMTKVAYVTTVDLTLRYILLEQMEAIQQAGYDVIAISADGPNVPVIEAAGIRHRTAHMTRNFTPLADLASLWQLYRVMRRERPTIVHTQTPKAGLLAQLAARLAGVPVVINTILGFYFSDNTGRFTRRFYITTEKIAARCSDVILSQNREDISTAIRERICPPQKIKHLGSGVDLRLFDPSRFTAEDVARKREALGISSDAPVVGFVGRLAAKRKGFLDFLASSKIVANRLPEARFLIVGEADHGKPDAVEPEVAGEYGLAESCVFVGQRPNDELPLLLKSMDVLVLPSIFEGMPQAVMEAAAMGVPSVVTNVRGSRETVEDGRSGLLVPLGDVTALAAAILKVLTDHELAQCLGHGGREMAELHFDKQKVIATVKAEYIRLLRKKGLNED
jgi:glycosyltransferase involved in cell wall biosynthesis